MSPAEVKNKMKTLSEGAFTDRVLTQMAGTFTTLGKAADFASTPPGEPPKRSNEDSPVEQSNASDVRDREVVDSSAIPPFANLAYNINIQLPESRDPAVYNAIFKALREHFR